MNLRDQGITKEKNTVEKRENNMEEMGDSSYKEEKIEKK